MIIKNGLINDAVQREAFVADILIEDGKIAWVGTSIPEAEANGVAANLHAMLYNPVRLLLLS